MEIGSSLPGPDQAPTILPAQTIPPFPLRFMSFTLFPVRECSVTQCTVGQVTFPSQRALHSLHVSSVKTSRGFQPSLTPQIIQAPRRAEQHSPWQLIGTCLRYIPHSVLIKMQQNKTTFTERSQRLCTALVLWEALTLSHWRLESRTGIRGQNYVLQQLQQQMDRTTEKYFPPTSSNTYSFLT